MPSREEDGLVQLEIGIHLMLQIEPGSGCLGGAPPHVGPATGDAFNTLAWLAAGQYLALSLGRANFVESDAPRGLRKVML